MSESGRPGGQPLVPGLVPLQGVVRHYDWGGHDYIPRLLGVGNAARKPFAELWLGAHHAAPAVAHAEQELPLDRLVADAPRQVLGPAVASRFGDRLPYLLKVLDARQMLSIQAHPNKRQAEEGFTRENAAGVPLSAPERSYKDDNHKPEVHVALTDFWLLHGFRPLEEIAELLRQVPELTPLMPEFGRRLDVARDEDTRRLLLRDLYAAAMTLPQEQVDALLRPLVARLEREAPTDRDIPDFWALRAARTFPLPADHVDRGIFSVYLLNLVRLRPGQGTYQPAGLLHAYLQGANVELMASSDNVLRGGLTPKHVDVQELLATLSFESGRPVVMEGEQVTAGERAYRTPAEEFEVARIDVVPGRPCHRPARHGPDILLVLDGAVNVAGPAGGVELGRGEALLASDGTSYTVTSRAPAVAYRAAVPST